MANLNINSIKNSKNIEEIYSNDYNFDRKKKLNVSNEVIPQEVIDEIEANGITSEGLEKIGVPYFTYKTQITLHGNFDKLKNPYSFGYKNLIINKNGSLGVKYNAIDEGKRKELAKMLRLVGISYIHSSTNSEFVAMRYANDETLEQLNRIVKIANDNKDLFVGGVTLQRVNFLGNLIVWITLSVNMIKQENVTKLAKAFGWSEQLQREADSKREAERLEYDNDWNKKMAEKREVTEKNECGNQSIEYGYC